MQTFVGYHSQRYDSSVSHRCVSVQLVVYAVLLAAFHGWT